MEKFAHLAIEALNAALKTHGVVLSELDLETPPDPKFGDLGYPCFKLSKPFRKSPNQIATELAHQIAQSGQLSSELSVQPVGPYVNFLIKPNALAQETLNAILIQSLPYGQLKPNSRSSWVLEYSSPNVAKTLNIYHLRPTALGACLDRIARFRGYRVTSINHLGDWGKQYGMLAVAFARYGIKPSLSLSMTELVELYVKINADAENDPSLEEQAKAAFLKLEQGDQAVTEVWKICCEISIREFRRIYDRLHIHFDHYWGESFYKDQLQPLLENLRQKGLLIESQGAWVVPVTTAEGKELPPCILQKSDGATIYATRDLAAAIYRYEKFHFDRMTYIVGAEQKLHFQQVFGVLRKMNLNWVDECEHVPFGLYRFKDAKMSTRKGNFVTLESVLDEAKQKVRKLMEERGDPPTDETTEAIAVGAVVFHDLKTDPVKDVEFDLDHMIDFNGETGPYLQYAHTRCQSLLRKGNFSENLMTTSAINTYAEKLTDPLEIALLKNLAQFPYHLERTISLSKASQLAHYLIQLTRSFGGFYKECQVIGLEDTERSHARLVLIEATRRILNQGLALLGIQCPERM